MTGLLPPGLAYKYSRIEPYGMYILFALILTGMLSIVMKPLMHFGLSIVKAILESMHRGYGAINYTNGVEFWFELDDQVGP